MASSQQPEVVLAQRLAANEKPVRTKAIKKLRKYIGARSQNATGGFTADELLKLWKGLFYCLWMQDKPLLQEELSNRISTLIHSFHSSDGEFLYLESFLQTIKREWTGIDRLRMDKFFQLVRFMFRQTFEMLKRKNWESSEVSRFLELLTAQLLQSGSGAPSGLQFHVLDLYMTELAAVGSEELSADQNFIFIEPFCKAAAKTKDRALFGAICNSIFSTIIDQAPFAIEDLMKELKGDEASDSDSGQASEEEQEEEQVTKKTKSKAVGKKVKQMNGHKSKSADSDDDDDDDDDLLQLEESDTEPCDEDVGPVLQFDYSGLADKLFQLASRSNTPSHNRQRLYKIIKILRDLAEGIFPQDEYPEEVSTDEDDDMFGSRKRMKKVRRRVREEEAVDKGDEEGAPAAKKSKGNKEEISKPTKQSKDLEQDGKETANLAVNNENNKKKKKKRKKKKKAETGGEEKRDQKLTVAESPVEETETDGQCLQASPTQDSISSVKVTEEATAKGQSETLLLCEGAKEPSVTVTEESIQPDPCDPDHQDQCVKVSKKTKKKKKQSPKVLDHQGLDEQGLVGVEAESSETHATASGKKTKKAQKAIEEAEVATVKSEEVVEETTKTPAKKKKKDQKPEKSLQAVNIASAEEPDCAIVERETPTESTAAAKKKNKTKNLKAEGAQEESQGAEIPSEHSTTEPLKKNKTTKGKEQEEKAEVSPAADESAVNPLKKKKRKNNKETSTEKEEAPVQEPHQEAEIEPCDDVSMTSSKKKKKKKKREMAEVGGGDTEFNEAEVPSIIETPSKMKKKRKIPVTFEYEADEIEAAASVNGHAEDEAAATDATEPPKQPSTKKKAKKSEFITFQNNAAVPTPLFCKTKGGLSTPLSSKKQNSQTPKSESKKVTFGLKNNKTAEFRKTDRSLLVSPDGSSRVPFDPKQKPKCGVLKSPASSLPARVKKTPIKKKSCPGTPQSTPKRRPSAADFF